MPDSEDPRSPDTATEPGTDSDAVGAEAIDGSPGTAKDPTGEDHQTARLAQRLMGRLPLLRRPAVGITALGVVLGIAIGLTAWLYAHTYRPAQLTDPTAQRRVLEAAKADTVAAMTYAPQTLDKDLNTAKSHLTGDFLNYYSQFTDQVVRPAVANKHIVTSANVVRAAIKEMHPSTATALLFINQTTTSSDRPEPSVVVSSVLVTMTKVDDTWLISAFNPT